MADFIVEGSNPIDPGELEKAKNTIKSALERSLGAEKNILDKVTNHAKDVQSLTLNLKSASSTMQWYQRNFQSTDTSTPDPPSGNPSQDISGSQESSQPNEWTPPESMKPRDPDKWDFLPEPVGTEESSQPNDWILPEGMKPRNEVKDELDRINDLADKYITRLDKITDLTARLKVLSSGNLPLNEPPASTVAASSEDDDDDMQLLLDKVTQFGNTYQTALDQQSEILKDIESKTPPLSQETPAEQVDQVSNVDNADIDNAPSSRDIDTLDDVLVNDILDAGDNLNRSSEHVVNAARVIEDAADTLDDIIDNNTFNPGSGGGDGDGGGDDDDPYELPEDDGGRRRRPREGGEDTGLTLEDIVGKTGKFAVQAYLGKVVANTIGAIANSIGSAVNQMGQTATQAIGSPGSVSPIGNVTTPVRTSAQIVGATGSLVGAGIGTAIAPGPGTVIGGLIGSVLGDKFTAAVGGMLDILISIDDNIKNLASDLRPFSVDILAASVEDSLAQLQARMNQAQELGPLLAENIRARTQFELAVRDLGTEMSKLFLPFLTSLTNLSTEIMEAITGNLETLIAVIKGAVTAIGAAFPWLANFANGVIAALQIISNNTKPVKTPAQLKEIQDFIEKSAMGQINAGNQGAGPGPSFPTMPGTLGVTF